VLLQALGEFANSQLEHQLDDVAFTAKRVSYLIEISRGGSFLGVTDCHQPARLVRPAPRLGTLMLVPRSPLHRTGGLCPLLACDNIHYVLEAGDKQNAFIDLLRDAAAATYDPALWSCVGFYRNRAEVECARQALLALDMPDGAVIGLSVGGPVVSRPAVREYWRAHYQRSVAVRLEGGRAGNCLVSGTVGPIALTHAKMQAVTAIGGLPTGAALVSCSGKAFCSYGWQKGANSPISPDRATAYALALNHLLKGGRSSRVDHGGVAFLFWTSGPAAKSPISILEDASAADIPPYTSRPDPFNLFHLAGISANGGRLISRCFLQAPFDAVCENAARWFEDLRIADAFSGAGADAPKLTQVLVSMARDEPSPELVIAVIRRAVLGEPLCLAVLASALSRLRTASGVDRLSAPRLALIRMCLNDRAGQPEMPAELDIGMDRPAYLCGRLLALHNALQYQTCRAANLADRFFAAASIRPAFVFPRLRLTTQAPGRLEGEIRALQLRLHAVPRVLNLLDQARFAMGFHHQSAANTGYALARDRRLSDKQVPRMAACG
jgi:CRISPR-associated protein Csd1